MPELTYDELRKRRRARDDAARLRPSPFETHRASMAAQKAIRIDLDRVLEEFNRERRRDVAAFNRYCNALKRCFESHPEVQNLGSDARLALMGAYFEAGIAKKRSAGRPKVDLEGLFAHVWHIINLELGEQGQPLLVGKVPAKEIAARCAFETLGDYTERQVSYALRPAVRTLPCPYYK